MSDSKFAQLVGHTIKSIIVKQNTQDGYPSCQIFLELENS